MKSITERLVFILFWCVWFTLMSGSNAIFASQKKQIIILNPGEHENLWANGILNKLRNNFVFKYPAYQLNIENISFEDSDDELIYYKDLSDYLSKKYARKKIDLVITIGYDALFYADFAKKNIFSGIPVLFSGINSIDSVKFCPANGYSGIVTDPDVFETMNIYLSLNPERQNLLVVFDNSRNGKITKGLLIPTINKLKSKGFTFKIYENIEHEKFINDAKENEKQSVILLAGRFVDEFNSFSKLDRSAELISQKCNIPIYSLNNQLVRNGIVADWIPNSSADADLLTAQSLRILQGEPIKDIPIIVSRNSKFLFDYTRLENFDIDLARLPQNSVILNRDETFLNKYLGFILFIVGFIISAIIITALIKNISGRKKAEKILKESEERFKEVYENSTVGIYRTTPDGKVLMANPSFMKILGYDSFEHLTAANIEEESKISEYDRKGFKQILEQEKVIRDFKSTWRKKDGTLVYLRENAKVYNDPDGRISYYEGVVEDITERKKAEDALIKYIYELKNSKETIEKSAQELKELNFKLFRSEEKLKELNQSKDKFFSLISHDLRSPFNSVLGFSEILAESIEELSVEEIKTFSSNIHVSLRNLYKLIENLLQWSSLQTGKFEFNPVQLNVYNLCENVCALLKGNAMKKRINISNTIPFDLTIYADEFMIYSVFQNLISNAIKFTNPGGKVLISGRADGDLSTMIVNDSGIGIPEKDVERLFKIDSNYSRLGTIGENGTGLGLVICKELIERNCGSIRIESELGKGSNFIFSLPKKSYNEK